MTLSRKHRSLAVMRRRGFLILVSTLLLLFLGWLSIPATLRLALAAAGHEVTFAKLRLGFTSAQIDGLRFEGAFEGFADHVVIVFTPFDLVQGEVHLVAINGLRLQGRLPARDTSASGSSGLPLLGYTRRLTVKKAQLQLLSASGALALPIDLDATRSGDRYQFEVKSSAATLESTRGHLHFDALIKGSLPASAGLAQGAAAQGSLVLRPDLGAEQPSITGAGSVELLVAKGRILARSSALSVDVAALPFAQTAAFLPSTLIAGTAQHPAKIVGVAQGDGWDVSIDAPLALHAKKGLQARAELVAKMRLAADGSIERLESGSLIAALKRSAWSGAGVAGGELRLHAEGSKSAIKGTIDLDLDDGHATWDGWQITLPDGKQRLSFALVDQQLEIRPLLPSSWQFKAKNAAQSIETGVVEINLAQDDEALFDGDGSGRWRHALVARIRPARINIGGQPLFARAESWRVQLEDRGSGADGLITWAGARLDLPEQGLILAEIGAQIAIDDLSIATGQAHRFEVRSMRHDREPPAVAPLALNGQVKMESHGMRFAGSLAGRTVSTLQAAFDGRHSFSQNTGSARFSLSPLTFAPDGLQPFELTPRFAQSISAAEGTVAAKGELTWGRPGLQGFAELMIDQLDLSAGPARFKQINSVLKFDSLWPPSTAGDQEVAIGRLDLGIPLTNGLLAGRLGRDGRLEVKRLDWRFAGGVVRTDPFTIGSDVDGLAVALVADGLELESLLKLTRLDDLKGNGIIDGRLPLTIDGAETVLHDGELKARSPGRLSYRPGDVAALQAGGQSVDLMLKALENFHYEQLRITLDGRTDGAMDIGLHLKGANPELHGGVPVEFNLALNGELANILRASLSGTQIPQTIEKRLEDFRR